MSEFEGKVEIPSDPTGAVTAVVKYMRDTVIRAGLNFNVNEYDPVAIASHRLATGLWGDARELALEYWWGVIDRIGIQDFQNPDALLARLAVCLLHPDVENVVTIEKQLSWFLDMLKKLGVDC